MKTRKHFIGMAVIAMVTLALAVIGCKHYEPALKDTSTYTSTVFRINTSDFEAVFGQPRPTARNARIFSLTQAELNAKIEEAKGKSSYEPTSNFAETGASYAKLTQNLQNFIDWGWMSSDNRTQSLNELESSGFVGVALYIDKPVVAVIIRD